MKKWMIGGVLIIFVVGAFAQVPSNNEITGDNIRWFEMKFKEKKLPNSDKRFSGVQMLLGFRHHLDTGKETAYLSLCIEIEKGSIIWKKNMMLEGSQFRDDENPKIYQIETVKEDRGDFISFLTGGKELYRLDILGINTAEDLVSFYRNNMDNSRGEYYFALRDRNAVIPMRISTENFQSFFKGLANPPRQNPKKVDEKVREELVKPYDLLAKYHSFQ